VSQTLSDLSPAVENDHRWYLLQKRRYESEIEKTVSFFREHNLDPVLIKGWAAGLAYPADEPRQFTDIDLAVSASDFERARLLMSSDALKGIVIDLHNEFRYLDTLPWNDLFSNSRFEDLDGVPVRILRPEDHLRLLCVHWLADGGIHKDRLRDIYYAVANRQADFDWSRCLDAAGANRREWILCVLGLTNKYFDLPLDGLPFADKARRIPEWVIKRVEKEWRDPVHLLPLLTFVRDPKQFLRQAKKRLPPSPIRAMVEMEGEINGPLFYYRIGCFVKRVPPFLKSLSRYFRSFFSTHD
jgi:hypothetical protein